MVIHILKTYFKSVKHPVIAEANKVMGQFSHAFPQVDAHMGNHSMYISCCIALYQKIVDWDVWDCTCLLNYCYPADVWRHAVDMIKRSPTVKLIHYYVVKVTLFTAICDDNLKI